MAEKNPHCAMRLTSTLLARVDALKENLSTAHVKASRSDVLRALVEFAIEPVEKSLGAKPPVSMADPMRGETADGSRLARGGGQGKKVGK